MHTKFFGLLLMLIFVFCQCKDETGQIQNAKPVNLSKQVEKTSENIKKNQQNKTKIMPIPSITSTYLGNDSRGKCSRQRVNMSEKTRKLAKICASK